MCHRLADLSIVCNCRMIYARLKVIEDRPAGGDRNSSDRHINNHMLHEDDTKVE